MRHNAGHSTEDDIIIDCDDVSISGSLLEICDYVRVTHKST